MPEPLTTHECSDSRPQTTAPWDEPVWTVVDGELLRRSTVLETRIHPRDIVARIRKLQERVRELEGLHALEVERLIRAEKRNAELVAALEGLNYNHNPDGPPCWCDWAPMTGPHSPSCIEARQALVRNKEAI